MTKHEEQDRPLNIVSNARSSAPFSENAGRNEANKIIKKKDGKKYLSLDKSPE